jgi:Zn-finger nucleic acid-binding protein
VEVTIDTCNKCGGVWLDSGELAELTTKKDPGGWFKRLWGAQE